MSIPRRIIIDTDAGWDDWLALLFLMKCQNLQIIGVTVNGVGESHLAPGMTNICNLLKFGGQSAQVYPGLSAPLAGSNSFPDSFRQKIDSFCGLTIPPAPGTPGTAAISTIKSTDFLHKAFETAASAGTTVDVLAIGGFTNLAALFNAFPLDGPGGPPSYKAGIGTIYAMAGAINVPGNVCSPDDPEWSAYCPNANAEWNVFIDPQAAAIVLGSGLKIVLVPLDATNGAPITTEFLQNYQQLATGDPYAGFVYQVLSHPPAAGPNYFFDPLAAVLLDVWPYLPAAAYDLVTSQSMQLQVETVLDNGSNPLGSLTPQNGGALPAVTVCFATTRTGSQFEILFNTMTYQSSFHGQPG